MIAWRISRFEDLRGLGGIRARGRWHNAGQPIVYLADHAASAMLEMLVHSEFAVLPNTFTLLKVDIPDGLVQALDPAQLSADWRDDQEQTRALGDAWLAQAPGAVLRVPSALAVEGWNYLLNPVHPDAAACKILAAIQAPLDPRFRPG
ncbi:RES family NAD+ phosphorylase [Chromobacterium subtsugae]|uniref:RES family NAD+ phosphorylase n=1 Tax=Chromobacterium subtsugae TaxID=251747 RepID=UPI000640C9AB|nr:RES family NAD+ phosphorylase [Chromobacterium subtsugae]